MKEFLKKYDEVVDDRGRKHDQFCTIYTCRVRQMEQRTSAKKVARRKVDSAYDVDEVEVDVDSDGDFGGGDEEMVGNINNNGVNSGLA